MGEAWTAITTLATGIAVWGGVGYGVDHLLGSRPIAMVLGLLVGNFAGVYLVYIRALHQEEHHRAA